MRPRVLVAAAAAALLMLAACATRDPEAGEGFVLEGQVVAVEAERTVPDWVPERPAATLLGGEAAQPRIDEAPPAQAPQRLGDRFPGEEGAIQVRIEDNGGLMEALQECPYEDVYTIYYVEDTRFDDVIMNDVAFPDGLQDVEVRVTGNVFTSGEHEEERNAEGECALVAVTVSTDPTTAPAPVGPETGEPHDAVTPGPVRQPEPDPEVPGPDREDQPPHAPGITPFP